MNPLHEALDNAKVKEKVLISEANSCEYNRSVISKIHGTKFYKKMVKWLNKKYFFIRKWVLLYKLRIKKYINSFNKKTLKNYPSISVSNHSENIWFPTQEEFYQKKDELASCHHLVIFDMRFVPYSELDRLLMKIKKPSEIYLIVKEPLNQKYTNIVFSHAVYYSLKIIIEEEDIGKHIRRLFQTRQKDFKHITIVEGESLQQIKRYRVKGWVQPIKKNASKKKVSKIKSSGMSSIGIPYPTLQELYSMREEISKKKNIILWDIENISHMEIDKILMKINHIGSIYCVSVEPLSQNVINRLFPYILLYDIKVRVGHENSDKKIIELVRELYKKYQQVTIISSDSDFVPIVKYVLSKNKKVKIIAKDQTKKRMLMYLKLDHKSLTVMTI